MLQLIGPQRPASELQHAAKRTRYSPEDLAPPTQALQTKLQRMLAEKPDKARFREYIMAYVMEPFERTYWKILQIVAQQNVQLESSITAAIWASLLHGSLEIYQSAYNRLCNTCGSVGIPEFSSAPLLPSNSDIALLEKREYSFSDSTRRLYKEGIYRIGSSESDDIRIADEYNPALVTAQLTIRENAIVLEELSSTGSVVMKGRLPGDMHYATFREKDTTTAVPHQSYTLADSQQPSSLAWFRVGSATFFVRHLQREERRSFTNSFYIEDGELTNVVAEVPFPVSEYALHYKQTPEPQQPFWITGYPLRRGGTYSLQWPSWQENLFFFRLLEGSWIMPWEYAITRHIGAYIAGHVNLQTDAEPDSEHSREALPTRVYRQGIEYIYHTPPWEKL